MHYIELYAIGSFITYGVRFAKVNQGGLVYENTPAYLRDYVTFALIKDALLTAAIWPCGIVSTWFISHPESGVRRGFQYGISYAPKQN